MNRVAGALLVVLSVVLQGQVIAQEAITAETRVEENSVIHLDQNWRRGWDDWGMNWYHHATQGAYMIPYELFMAL